MFKIQPATFPLFIPSLVSMVTFASLCHDLQAVDSRDSVAMALYSQCFSWIIMRINQKIKGKDNFKSIGILDIFGFENFEVKVYSSNLSFIEQNTSSQSASNYEKLGPTTQNVLSIVLVFSHERFEDFLVPVLFLLVMKWAGSFVKK